MSEGRTLRRLAAILAVDVVAYSRLMELDEAGAHRRLKRARELVIDPLVAGHRGRIVKLMGDGGLYEFASASDAVLCAVGIQRGMIAAESGWPEPDRLRLRIGANLGDVIVEGDDIYGDGVNIAARLEALAEPCGVWVSGKIREEVRRRLDVSFIPVGRKRLKNIAEAVEIWRVDLHGDAAAEAPGAGAASEGRRRVAAALRDHIARQHLSREQFAFRTKLGKSTVDKLLIGLFSERTLSIVEEHTKLALRPMLNETPEPPEAEPAADPPEPLARPSIAVLPFANLSGDPGQDYLADGLTEDVITALARLRWLLVIARNSTFVYKGKAVDVRAVARDLGVRYVLEGSVRAAAERLRVVAQLVEAESGRHIWAERYDRRTQDVFAVLDDIVERVVAAVEPHLYAEESVRAARRPERLDAWGLVARALQLVNRLERARNAEAQRLLARAVELEPDYATAHALLGWAIYWSAHIAWRADAEQAYGEAMAAAERAVALDGRDPWGRITLGFSLSRIGQHDQALAELQAALSANPSFALAHSIHGWILLRAGQFEEAIEATRQALRLSPVDTFSGFYASTHALALLGAGRFEEALPHMRVAVATLPEYAGHYNMLISCCGHLGRLEEAREFLAARGRIAAPLRLSAVRPNPGRFAHWDVFLEGLRKAGVPE